MTCDPSDGPRGNRSRLSLQAPDPSADYAAFPTCQHQNGSRWYRAHHEAHSPWWFSSTPGRYNLTRPRGTLNAGDTDQTALREMLGPVLLGTPDIPETAVDGVMISCLQVPGLTVADFLHPAASSFGVLTGDAAGPMEESNALTRAWARVLDQAGHHGIRARSRCGAEEAPQCLYVFGTAGVHALGTVLPQYSDSAHAVAEAMPGYRLVPRPHSETLIIDP